LNKRREDIPILFYHFLKSEIEASGLNDIVFSLELEALDEFMRLDIQWTGGIRTIQYLTKRIFLKVKEKNSSELKITKKIVNETIEQWKKSMNCELL